MKQEQEYMYLPTWMHVMSKIRKLRSAARLSKVGGFQYKHTHIILKNFQELDWIKVSEKNLTDVRAKEFDFTRRGAAMERHVNSILRGMKGGNRGK